MESLCGKYCRGRGALACAMSSIPSLHGWMLASLKHLLQGRMVMACFCTVRDCAPFFRACFTPWRMPVSEVFLKGSNEPAAFVVINSASWLKHLVRAILIKKYFIRTTFRFKPWPHILMMGCWVLWITWPRTTNRRWGPRWRYGWGGGCYHRVIGRIVPLRFPVGRICVGWRLRNFQFVWLPRNRLAVARCCQNYWQRLDNMTGIKQVVSGYRVLARKLCAKTVTKPHDPEVAFAPSVNGVNWAWLPASLSPRGSLWRMESSSHHICLSVNVRFNCSYQCAYCLVDTFINIGWWSCALTTMACFFSGRVLSVYLSFQGL